MGTGALRVVNVSKSYHRGGREIPALRDVQLTIDEGEIFALLGPSGCGKSTLLRAIAGLEPISSGRIEIPGADSADGATRAVGIVFQDPLLLPWLTVAENVALGLRYRANRAARGDGSVEQHLRDLGLAALADSYPNALSGGQAQRVNLARAIVIRPRLLLLDEPFSALDPPTRRSLQDWLLEMTAHRQLTVVVVTHDVDEAMYLGDRVGLMSRCPGTILRIWEMGPRGREPAHRWMPHDRAGAIRQEILELYQVDVPARSAAPSWVI